MSYIYNSNIHFYSFIKKVTLCDESHLFVF